jgi:hypothetical protein
MGIGDLITHTPAFKPSDGVKRDEDWGHIFLRIFPKTELAKRIVKWHAPDVFAHFMMRNAEYGDDNDFNLGSRGQYVDISRKVQKLKRRMWDGQPERDGEESTRTIVTELIGHLFMTLDYLDQEEGHAEEASEG